MSNQPIIEAKDLQMHFPIYGGLLNRQVATVHAVNGVSFSLQPGQTLGLVGESGCGKTTVGRAILRLYQPTAGSIQLDGEELVGLRGKALRAVRKKMQMIFQDPFESLNSRHTVERIIEEPLLIHKIGSRKERRAQVEELLERVGLPKSALEKFPHEFSGGQRQRIGIARALTLKPKLVVCDEPVSALDVSIQSQVLNLLVELQREFSLSYIFIAHDLATVKHMSDEVAVMYLGKIVEIGSPRTILDHPQHPYTQSLISAVPIADPTRRKKRVILQGEVPSPIRPPSGCSFHTRCPFAKDLCRAEIPELKQAKNLTHKVACHFAGEVSLL